MKASEVVVGARYIVNVSGNRVPVKITRAVERINYRKRKEELHWYGVNEVTGREIYITSPMRLQRRLRDR